MTVDYVRSVHTTSSLGPVKLLCRWKGSIYKLMWLDMLIFFIVYYGITFTVKYTLKPSHYLWYEKVVRYSKRTSDTLDYGVALMFFVSQVGGRFFAQFYAIPWPQHLACLIVTYIRSDHLDEKGHIMRRTIMRYVCASTVMCLSSISLQIKRRFPTLEHITEAGLLTPAEQRKIEENPSTGDKHFIPFIWAIGIVGRARKLGYIKDGIAVTKLIDAINAMRGNCGGIFGFDWIQIPLVYTQLVTFTIYLYFFVFIVAHLQTSDKDSSIGWQFPYITFLKFVIYRGWLKVAEQSINPWGDDDDDFNLNAIVDRIISEAFLIVDEMYDQMPELKPDPHWDIVLFEIPYTNDASKFKVDKFVGSALPIIVPKNQQKIKFVRMKPHQKHEHEDHYEHVPDPEQDNRAEGLLRRRSSRRVSAEPEEPQEEDDDNQEASGDKF